MTDSTFLPMPSCMEVKQEKITVILTVLSIIKFFMMLLKTSMVTIFLWFPWRVDRLFIFYKF